MPVQHCLGFRRSLLVLLTAVAGVLVSTWTDVARAGGRPPFVEYSYCDPASQADPTGPLRLVSYNIKSGTESSLLAIMLTLKRMPFEVLALQEVDVGMVRSQRQDQAGEIARYFGLCGFFAQTVDHGAGGLYGIALLSRFPLKSIQVELLPQAWVPVFPEPRVAIFGTIPLGENRQVVVANTHLALIQLDQVRQVTHLKAKLEEFRGLPVILTGDFNATPGSKPINILACADEGDAVRLRESVEAWPGYVPIAGQAGLPTFPSASPKRQLDHFFVSEEWDVKAMGVELSQSSDHRPLWMHAVLR